MNERVPERMIQSPTALLDGMEIRFSYYLASVRYIFDINCHGAGKTMTNGELT